MPRSRRCCEGWPDEKRRQVAGLQLVHDPEVELADRATALARMREIIQAEDGQGEFRDNRVFFLALAATREVGFGGHGSIPPTD